MIKTTSHELTKAEKYKLTKDPAIQKMTTAVDSVMEVAAYAIYDDEQNGKTTTILSILTTEGDAYATNSEVFRREFEALAEIFAELDDNGKLIPFPIKPITGTSKSNRTFVTVTYAG